MTTHAFNYDHITTPSLYLVPPFNPLPFSAFLFLSLALSLSLRTDLLHSEDTLNSSGGLLCSQRKAQAHTLTCLDIHNSEAMFRKIPPCPCMHTNFTVFKLKYVIKGK